MNKDNAAQYLPIVQAVADGKTIQFKGNLGKWEDMDDPAFFQGPESYRIKPEPREWNAICSESGELYHYTNGQTLASCKLVRVREVLD
jgi:hypothetical protein